MKRIYLFTFIITLITGLILGYTIWKLPPTTETEEIIISNLIIFGLTFTIFFTGIFGFIIFIFRRLLLPPDLPRIVFRQALREAFWVALIMDGLLALQKIAALNPLNSILLVFIFLVLETFLLLRYQKSLREKNQETKTKNFNSK